MYAIATTSFINKKAIGTKSNEWKWAGHDGFLMVHTSFALDRSKWTSPLADDAGASDAWWCNRLGVYNINPQPDPTYLLGSHMAVDTLTA